MVIIHKCPSYMKKIMDQIQPYLQVRIIHLSVQLFNHSNRLYIHNDINCDIMNIRPIVVLKLLLIIL